MIEADLRRRLAELEYKNKVLEADMKSLIDNLDTELYFLNTRLTICELVCNQIEQVEKE